MNALPASSSPEFISPLASKLVQFLAQKRAMGSRIDWCISLPYCGTQSRLEQTTIYQV
jgi:hypothetical protein